MAIAPRRETEVFIFKDGVIVCFGVGDKRRLNIVCSESKRAVERFQLRPAKYYKD